MPKSKGWSEDPLIRGLIADRVKAAIDSTGLSRREIARQLRDRLRAQKAAANVSSQTLDYVSTGVQRSLRSSVLTALEELTGWPIPYLTGKTDFPFPNVLPRGFESARELPAPSQIELARFLRECHRAIRRDLEDWAGSESRANEWWDRGFWIVYSRLATLVRVGSWSARLLEVPESGLPIRDRQRYERQQQVALLGLVQAFRAILEPWLEGETRLNIRALAAMQDAALDLPVQEGARGAGGRKRRAGKPKKPSKKK